MRVGKASIHLIEVGHQRINNQYSKGFSFFLDKKRKTAIFEIDLSINFRVRRTRCHGHVDAEYIDKHIDMIRVVELPWDNKMESQCLEFLSNQGMQQVFFELQIIHSPLGTKSTFPIDIDFKRDKAVARVLD